MHYFSMRSADVWYLHQKNYQAPRPYTYSRYHTKALIYNIFVYFIDTDVFCLKLFLRHALYFINSSLYLYNTLQT